MGVWETSTGFNKLNATLQVGASSGGTTYTGSQWFTKKGDATPVQFPTSSAVVRSTVAPKGTFSMSGRAILPGAAPATGITVKRTLVNGRAIVKAVAR